MNDHMLELQVMLARAEFYGVAATTSEYVKYLRANGLDRGRLNDSKAGATGILEVVDCGNGRFDWNGQGDWFPAFICEALDADGETVLDFVAWPIDRPRHVMSLFGRAPILGLWDALNPATFYMGKALIMHRSPVEWLQADCQGAAIVDPKAMAYLFRDIPGPIAARDRMHAQELLAIARSVVDERQIVVAAATASINENAA